MREISGINMHKDICESIYFLVHLFIFVLVKHISIYDNMDADKYTYSIEREKERKRLLFNNFISVFPIHPFENRFHLLK